MLHINLGFVLNVATTFQVSIVRVSCEVLGYPCWIFWGYLKSQNHESAMVRDQDTLDKSTITFDEYSFFPLQWCISNKANLKFV